MLDTYQEIITNFFFTLVPQYEFFHNYSAWDSAVKTLPSTFQKHARKIRDVESNR